MPPPTARPNPMSVGPPWIVDHTSTGQMTNRYSSTTSTAAEATIWATGTSLVELGVVAVLLVMRSLLVVWESASRRVGRIGGSVGRGLFFFELRRPWAPRW